MLTYSTLLVCPVSEVQEQGKNAATLHCVKGWQAKKVALQVICSRDVKVAGLLGSAAAMDAKSSAVAEQQVGLGGTTKWKLASLVSVLPSMSCATLSSLFMQ